MPRSRLLRLAALFGLSAFLGGLVLPVASVVLAKGSVPLCCSKGRCCCADDSTTRDDRTCLRRGCGCEQRGQAVSGEPLRADGVLSPPPLVAVAGPAEVRWDSSDERPLARARRPAVPPPRPCLSA